MSELKYYKLFHRASALTSPNFISVAEFGTDDEIYLKSEADAELNRQKYLRCESLIKTCSAKSQTWSCRYYYAETDSRRKICFDFMIHYNKRAEVLRKLAEKFKEADK